MRGSVVLLLLVLLAPGAARAQEPVTSDNVEFVRNLPLESESAIGAKRVGRHLYLTGTRSISIYDLEDPLDPELLSTFPLGYQWQNEDVSTNGRIMLVSESLPGDILHVWDVSNPESPMEIGRALLAGNHTSECLHDCTWSYGSEGDIVDLRDPTAPELAGNWMDQVGLEGGAHDVNEIRPGLVAVATLSDDFLILDTEDPLHPRVVATGPHPEPEDWILHQVVWPNAGEDGLFLASGEGNDGPFLTYRVGSTASGPTFTPAGRFTLGSTSHWFDPHPRFNDGGLVAIAWYGRGTRFLQVEPDGEVAEVGHYEPGARPIIEQLPMPSTWAARWITDDVVYAIDNGRGVDILRWRGEIPAPPAPAAPPAPPAAGGAGETPSCAMQSPAAVRDGRGVRFPGAARVEIRRHARGRRLQRPRVVARVTDGRLRAARLPDGVYEARVAGPGGLRRVAIERRRGRLHVAGPLELSATCGALESAALSAPAFGVRAPLRLRYRLRAPAGVSVRAGRRMLRAPGAAGSHTLTIPSRGVRRGARVIVRITVPGAGTFRLAARRL